MGTFRNLTAWQKSMDLVDAIYLATRRFPISERLGLTQQLRSAATSIPSNIAEGFGRYTVPDQTHFLRMARRSVYELQTEIEIAERQRLLTRQSATDLLNRADEIGRLINGLHRALLRAKG